MSELTAVDVLRNFQKQCDFGGVEVQVSRQALDEVLDRHESLEAENAALKERYRWVPESAGDPPDGETVLWRIESATGVTYQLHIFDDTPGRRSWPSFGTHWMPLPEPPEQPL